MVVKTKQQGFTLIEMVIVIILLLILVSTGANILIQEFQVFNIGQDLVNADWQGRAALNRITRDIHNAVAITTANNNTFTFKNSSDNIITYTLGGINNKQLIYTDTNFSQLPLADNVQSLTFNYYNQNGVDLGSSPTTGIRYISITMNIVNRSANFNITTAVYLWNITN